MAPHTIRYGTKQRSPPYTSRCITRSSRDEDGVNVIFQPKSKQPPPAETDQRNNHRPKSMEMDQSNHHQWRDGPKQPPSAETMPMSRRRRWR
ncbi:unnamed protein product [Arabis nemorensis]|uniref:Uncharacterized protein n=1 Tax=Arabis nemorensis TaxID=586526 RepID=A0A565AZ24_9BRAS|nr:unnamed protein product [Arabis nemorensis]